MKELLLIGIGTGNPDHVTFAAEKAIREADVILVPRKGEEKSDLADLRHLICDRAKPRGEVLDFDLPVRDASGSYVDGVNDWHDAIARAWTEAASRRPEATRVALLIWGDPSLYDSSLRIAERLSPQPRITVIPGITALQALTAAHAIPLNEIGAPVVVTTGRRLRDEGWPPGADTVAVMLDGSCAFETLDPEGVYIWWGAFLAMPNQRLLAGPLTETGPAIVDCRARARAEHGWIMDTYLLRRISG